MRERFAAARVAAAGDGDSRRAPAHRPGCFVLAGDVVYSRGRRQAEVDAARCGGSTTCARNPHASLLVDHYADDWSQLWWIRVDGDARVVADDDGRSTLLAEKYAQYRDARPPGPVIAIDGAAMAPWSGRQPDLT